ncbi:hypothetical protein JCGZ_07532 [Jatropha curcas]|uniref:Uncharacterized protein n=1 Tax=Jatropha curcas TaxID=180498 RepID=A0A067KCK6_JATCU|nr:uncharacterized protein LOC105638015 [Jatropha curcas]KDP33961.1 hypothetical protein JCGZ_07532 [Jatropha curcas]
MNVLDSPLEALAFDYASFGIFTVVNNLWTWVALITAAISFWRIRTSGAGGVVSSSSLKSEPLSSVNCIDCHGNKSRTVIEKSAIKSVIEPSKQPVPAAATSKRLKPASARPSVFENDGVIKAKFVVYYEDDREGEGNGDCEEYSTVVGEWENGSGYGEWRESWEKVLRIRMGDMDWYRYQDLTAINGNVVRLWDGFRRKSTAQAVLFW